MTRTCHHCGKEFERIGQRRHQKYFFCNRRCAAIGMAKIAGQQSNQGMAKIMASKASTLFESIPKPPPPIATGIDAPDARPGPSKVVIKPRNGGPVLL